MNATFKRGILNGLDSAARTRSPRRLPEPVKAAAVRVLGVPTSGDHPQPAFSSCAEWQAFGE